MGRAARHPRGLAAGDADRAGEPGLVAADVAGAASCAPAAELLLPRTDIGADSIGAYVRCALRRRGPRAPGRPAVGSIYAADTDHFSLAAVPQLAELAVRSRSVLLASRRPAAAPAGPVFYARHRGRRPTGRRRIDRNVAANGGELRFDAAISELAVDGGDWRVDGEVFDGVVLACPARAAARLLAAVESGPRRSTLATIPTAGVALVTLAIARRGLADTAARAVGLPRAEAAATTGHRGLVRFAEVGASRRCGSRHPARLAGPRRVVGTAPLRRRVAGRRSRRVETSTSASSCSQLPSGSAAGHNAFPAIPAASRHDNCVGRAIPSPGHQALAGASYHGIGIPACIRSGQQAAVATLQR